MNTFLQVLVMGIALGGVYALIAFALAIVYSVTRLLNFSHGDLMAVAMYFALIGFTWLGLDPYLSMFIISPIMFCLGMLLFYLIFSRVLRAELLLVVQITLGMVFVIENGLLMIFSANYQIIPTVLSGERWFLGPVILRAPLFVAFLVSVALAVVFFFILFKTDFGRAVRAIAEDPIGAALAGINVRKIQMLVFSGSLGVLGLVGPLVTPVFILEPSIGLHLSLISFIVLILGGSNNFLGILVAGIIIGLSESFGSYYMNPPELAAMVPYVIFILVLFARPRGVVG